MKYQFLIFFSIVLIVYSAVNFYIYSRASQGLPSGSTIKLWFGWTFLFLSSTYIAGRVLEKFYLSVFSDVLTWIGSFWLAFMLYGFLLVVLIDLVRIINGFTGFLPAGFFTSNAKQWMFVMGISVIFITVAAGYINAISPRIKVMELTVNKSAGNLKDLKIAMASDIHMGTLIGPKRTSKLVKSLNELKPDIILLAGDIVDEDLAPVIKQNLGECLKQLYAPFGVYGITGNHEYIGGAESAVKYLEDNGIIMLRDTVIQLNNSFYLAGREDRDKNRFSGRKRLEVRELFQNIDTNLPVILLDHQPFELDKAAEAGVDLQLSGHTHHGQLWPLNYLTRAIYEVSMGYKKKGDAHFYVSPGFGGWGPPVRTGNRPEVVFITLTFNK
ncbi:MAG: metallophosphoesterase [Lentimicrobium sp.]|jgi:predicted MPP superfamily phosphohydrolase|nr:metallophosphoesterase [Lentimicrobium sp.]MDY0026694.1 metallophosphoesterase [Lentimicrobium sp.]